MWQLNPFAWNDKYSLGPSDVDSEHQALFRLAEQLCEATNNGMGEGHLAGLFARLASYARFHFENEEVLMRRIGFPEFALHRQEHEGFIARLSSLESEFQSGSAYLDKALMEFLQSWLERHVCGTDQRFAQYLQLQNQPPVGGGVRK